MADLKLGRFKYREKFTVFSKESLKSVLTIPVLASYSVNLIDADTKTLLLIQKIMFFIQCLHKKLVKTTHTKRRGEFGKILKVEKKLSVFSRGSLKSILMISGSK